MFSDHILPATVHNLIHDLIFFKEVSPLKPHLLQGSEEGVRCLETAWSTPKAPGLESGSTPGQLTCGNPEPPL